MERKQIYRILVTSAFITGFAAALIGVQPAAAATAVSACGTITTSGSYYLTKSIGVPGNCMEIRASNVTFNLMGFGIVGNGTIGRGVTIARGATSVHMANGQISAWAVGVEDLGSGALLQNLKIRNNTLMGVALAGVTDSTVQGDRFPGNGSVAIYANATRGALVGGNISTGSGKYGVWVRSSTQFTIRNNQISQDGIAGIFVGCSGHGITNTQTCLPDSAGVIASNRVIYNTHLGIAIDRGNNHIQVTNNQVSASGKFDLFDSNPACGTNTWSHDTYKTHNRACAM
jgi:parallel beta-helix repeat protein